MTDKEGFIEKIPFQGKLTKDRHLIAPAHKPLRDRVDRIIAANGRDRLSLPGQQS